MFRNDATQSEEIHCVFGRELVGGTKDESQAVDWHAHRLQQRSDYVPIVFGVVLHEFDRCFEVVEEAVYVCQEYLNFATGLEELRELKLQWGDYSLGLTVGTK